MASKAVRVLTLQPHLVPCSASYVGLIPTAHPGTPSSITWSLPFPLSVCLKCFFLLFTPTYLLLVLQASVPLPYVGWRWWISHSDYIRVFHHGHTLSEHGNFFLFYIGLAAVYTVGVVIWFCLVVAVSVHIYSGLLSFQARSSSALPYPLGIRWVSVLLWPVECEQK